MKGIVLRASPLQEFNLESIVLPVQAALMLLGSVLRKKPLNILIADDDEDDRELFMDAIKRISANIEVEEACDGAQLMTRLNSKDELPDLIFLDLNMPRLRGVECLKKIRTDNKLKNIPVIIYSTSTSREDIDATYSLGADYYLPKPDLITELRNTLKVLLTKDWDGHSAPMRKEFVFDYRKYI